MDTTYASATEVQQYYLAYFGRPADFDGQNYWIGKTTAQLVAGFSSSAEYATLYSGMTNDQRIEQIYSNLFGRSSDAVGKAYWLAGLNSGRESVSSIVASMQENALGVDKATVANRTTYAINFTAAMDTQGEILAYSGTAAANSARAAVSAVSYTDTSLATSLSNITTDVAAMTAHVTPAEAAERRAADAIDNTPPVMSSAAVSADGLSIVVTYSEALTGTAEAGDYAVTLSSGSTTVNGATIGTGANVNKVTLTLSDAIIDAVTASNVIYSNVGTANSIRDAATNPNSAVNQTLATVDNSSVPQNYTLLVVGAESITGTSGNDSFSGTYTDGGTGTFNTTDTIAGGGGTDTLNVAVNTVAIVPSDTLWSGISGIEKLVITTTGAGAQNITTGTHFEAAFHANGVNLSTIQLAAGALIIDMNSTPFTGAATITARTDGAGDHSITTGTGVSTVTSTTSAGNQTIKGVNLETVTATSAGAGIQTIGDGSGMGAHLNAVTAIQHGSGAQTIISTSTSNVTVTVTNDGTSGDQTVTTNTGNDTVTATTWGGNNVYSTGAGNDTITLNASGVATSNIITGGAGADSITLVINAAPDTIVIGNLDSGITIATADRITNFTAADSLKMGTAGDGTAGTGTYVEAGALVADFAAALVAANTALATLAGTSGASELYSFQWDATNGYLFNDIDGNGTADQVVVLVGVVGTAISAANIIV